MDQISKKVFSDINIIFKMMPKQMINKINPQFIKFIKENTDEGYKSDIKPYIPLRSQKICQETQAILALIYKKYLITDEEKKEILQNERNQLEITTQKYDRNNLFKKDKIEKKEEDNKLIKIEETSKWKKIISKIKKFFKNGS